MSRPHEIQPFASFHSWADESRQQGWSRRDFMRNALGAASAAAMKPRHLLAASGQTRRKVIIVTFGGGARDDETFSALGQRNIPHLIHELAPQSTFFPQVVNRGILGHYVATASIASGHYETFNNFVAQGPANPTLFEYFRKGLGRPAHDAWVIAPSNGFEGIGTSRHAAYGAPYGATVILPKRLLAHAARASNATLRDYDSLLHDNYESPYRLPSVASDAASGQHEESAILAATLKLSLEDFAAHARTLDSPDELSLYIARQVMREIAPSLLFITLHDIDVAHSGAFSLYLDAIQRADRLCAELWQEAEANPEYKSHTTMLVMPDFGRDADGEANGFQHHRTGSPEARTTWMLALGQGARPGTIIQRPIESIDLVPTVGVLFGFATPHATGKPIAEIV